MGKFLDWFRGVMKVPRWAFLIKFGAAFIVTLAVLGGGFALGYHYLFGGMDRDAAISPEAGGYDPTTVRDELINVALFGVDTDDPEMAEGRSDSIVIVTIDQKRKEIRMSAIQRDTYVTVEGHGKTKINHAYAYGGPVLAVKTLNQNFGLNITDYAVINFTNMEKVIDVLGGIQLEVSSSYLKEANMIIQSWNSNELISGTGLQELTGIQVMAMARARKNVGGTGARANMHELVLAACMEKVKTMSVLKYPELIKTLMELVKTTLSVPDVTNTGIQVLTSGYTIRNAVFPLAADQPGGDGGRTINGVWYLTYNEETAVPHIQDFVFDGILYGEE